MNALYTHALRQTQSITSDLALLENALAGSSTNTHTPYDTRSPSPSAMSPSLQGNGVDTAGLNGQIVASLAALQRTVDDYEGMARRELVEDKKGKAASRVERIKTDYNELRKQYDKVKQAQQSQRTAAERSALFSSGLASSSAASSSMQQRRVPQSPSLGPSESPYSYSQPSSRHPSPFQPHAHAHTQRRSIYQPNVTAAHRTDSALDEHSFINDTGNQLDAYIAQGQAILGNLGNQRDVLKGTQRRLLSAANTLGLSRDTINFIERRGKGDMAVFIVGAVTTIICFILILRYFG